MEGAKTRLLILIYLSFLNVKLIEIRVTCLWGHDQMAIEVPLLEQSEMDCSLQSIPMLHPQSGGELEAAIQMTVIQFHCQ